MDPQTGINNNSSQLSYSSRLTRASSLRRFLPHVRRQKSIALSTSPLSPPPSPLPPSSAPSVPPTLPACLPNTKPVTSSLLRRDRARSILTDTATAANRLPPASHEAAILFQKMRTPNLGINVPGQVSDRDTNNNNNNGRAANDANTREVAGASPLSSPRTPHTPGPHSPYSQSFGEGYDAHQQSPNPVGHPLHSSPKPPGKSSKSFFSNPIANRSTTKVSKTESPSRHAAPPTSSAQGSMAQVYNFNRGLGSSPELTVTDVNSTETSLPITGDDSQHPDSFMATSNFPKKKSSKHKFLGLGRKASINKDEDFQQLDIKASASQKSKNKLQRETRQDRGLKEKTSELRNHSIDRQASEDSIPHTSNGAHGLQHNIRSTGTRAADGFGRAAKGLLGKLSTRSNNSTDAREAQEKAAKSARDEAAAQQAHQNKSYKLINLPLEEQTRKTRICKRLEECKDKTEFWLPAVAYRCIDYLNDKGMAHEGLYRVPGSEREIRNWIYRFDNEKDIDLLNEEDLYDVNTISSMFKAWLRDLPDEVFPKSLQHKISSSVPKLQEQQGAPEILISELSQLAPFNYYLLFAVTAHITMLLNSSKENKMTFHNLCVCFMPALKMELPCFQWLILDWKNCWRGCATERDYLEREYTLMEQKDPEQEGSTRPLQHFDRYPPPQARNNSESKSITGKESIKQHGSRDVSVERGRATKNGQSSHGSSQSPAARPATSPTDQSMSFPEPTHSRREKRPAPLESIGHSRRGSEPATNIGSRKGDGRGVGQTSIKDNGSHAKDSELRRIQELHSPAPEIGPVKPLSPIGNLEGSFAKQLQ